MRLRSATLGAGGLIGAGVVAHLGPATTSWRQARNRLLPALAGVGRSGHVALTFDDGPDPVSTPAMLDALDGLGWKATFFFLGSQIRRSPMLAAEVTARGHEVGVHGDTHTSHLQRPWTWTTDDVTRGRDLVVAVTGTRPVWFRPPYGTLSSASLIAARRAGLRTVLWTTWGRDWRNESTAANVASTVVETWHRGATVLLHDSDVTSAPGSWRATLGALPVLAKRWAAEGLQVGPLRDHGL